MTLEKLLIKEYEKPIKFNNADDVVKELTDIKDMSKECFVSFLLDTQNQIIARQIISVGTLNTCPVHPREVFREAIRYNSNTIILAHNHPSGSLKPSNEDIDITKRLKEAGEIIGIKILDHIIISKLGHTCLNSLV